MVTEGIIIALVAGGASVLGHVITNNKDAKVREEKQKSLEASFNKLEEKVENVTENVTDMKITVSSLVSTVTALDKKVDKHNSIIERTYEIEKTLTKDETQLQSVIRQIKELRK